MLQVMAASQMRASVLEVRLESALVVVAHWVAKVDMEASLNTFRKKNIFQSVRNWLQSQTHSARVISLREVEAVQELMEPRLVAEAEA